MDEKDFVLQQRFQIRPTANAVNDTLLQVEVKVEPRVMKLLCILAKHQGQLVKREQLVTEIWNDYGGGEAGLNHAVSTLRKLLHDTSKELVETIPTKGYILHAEVTEIQSVNNLQTHKQKTFSKRSVMYASLILLAATSLYLLFQSGALNKNEAAPSSAKDLSVPFTRVNNGAEETWSNTIVTFDSDSTEYKLKVIGDSRPQFYINGRLLSPDEMEKHLDLINNLKKQLRDRSE